MLNNQIFETLPIAIIATGVLCILLAVQHMLALAAGIVFVVTGCYLIYRRVNEFGIGGDVKQRDSLDLDVSTR